jgi:hypothetical protein
MMDIGIKKWTGFLVHFVVLKHAKDKEVPIHVYEHTLNRLDFAMPDFRIYTTVFQTHVDVLIGWVMCLGKRTEYGVFRTIRADVPVSRNQRHPFDRFYNFFSRSAWTVRDMAHQVAVAVVGDCKKFCVKGQFVTAFFRL